ncbi:MAG: S9 family peptidase, partial [Chitinophagaceae bacterium]
MRKSIIIICSLLSFHYSNPQKKPLDHSVYDSWQSIGERMISNDGKWVVYTINVQEGDNELVIQSADAKYKKTVARGYTALITEDSRFVVFKIKPFYKDTREAKIKKKKPDDMPKDSLAIVELGKDSVYKVAKVKTYKSPEKGFGWVAYHLEKKPEPEKSKTSTADSTGKKTVDSLKRTIDSLMQIVNQPQPSGKKKKKRDEESIDDSRFTIDETDAEGDDATATSTPEGTELVLRNLKTGDEKVFPFVSGYYFDKYGKKLLIEATRNSKDSLSKASVLLVNLERMKTDTISRGGNDFKSFVFSEDGSQLAFVAERDA